MPKERFDAFISYARADDCGEGQNSLVRKLYSLLNGAQDATGRPLRIFLDRCDMPGRTPTFTDAIADAISRSERLILMIGEHMASSAYVTAEWQFAQRSGCQIYPVLYAHSTVSDNNYKCVPPLLAARHVFDLRSPGTPLFEDELRHLQRELSEPLSQKAPLYGVPAYDDKNYVIREQCMLAIQRAIFSSDAADIDCGRFTGIFGMAGSGKSSIAAFLCKDATIRRTYPDGVVWLSVTRNYQIGRIWLQLASYFPHLPRDLSEDEVEQNIRKYFSDKRCFFVLDDVWSPQVLTMLHNALGDSANHFLVTTRERSIIQLNVRHTVALDVMEREDALLLLSRYAGCKVGQLPQTAEQLADDLGYLPLALAIAGAMYRDGKGWELVKQTYEAKKLEFLSRNIDHYAYEGHESAFVAIQMSVDSLQNELAAYYKKLAVFPKSEDVPLGAVHVLWQDTLHSQLETESIISDLASKALLSYDSEKKILRLHDLQNDFLLLVLKDIRGMHAAFVEAYRQYAVGGWYNGPNDGYFFNNLIYHLISTSKEAEQEAFALLGDYRWIERKLRFSGIEELREDYRIANRPGAPALLLRLQEFLTISAHVLAEDPAQLPSQLYGRLLHFDEPELQALLRSAKSETTTPWLRPEVTCMLPTDTGLVSTINTGEWIMSFAQWESSFLICDWIGRIRAFDLVSKDCTSQHATGCKILCSAKREALLYTCDENCVLRVFDPEAFSQLYSVTLNALPLQMAGTGDKVYVLLQGGALLTVSEAGEPAPFMQLLPDTVAFAMLEEGVVAGTSGGTLYFQDPYSTEPFMLDELHAGIKCIQRFEKDAYASLEDGRVIRLDTDTMEISPCFAAVEPVLHLTLWGDILVAGGYLGGLYFYNVKERRLCGDFDIGARIDALTTRNGMLITGNSAGKIQSFDLRLLRANEQDAGFKGIKRCCAFDGNLAMTDRQGMLRIIDPGTLRDVQPPLHIGIDVRAMQVFEGRLLIADPQHLYELQGDALQLLLALPSHEIRSFAIFEGMLCLCDKNGSVCTFDINGTELQRCEKEAYVTALCTDYGQLLVANDEGEVRFFTKDGRVTKRFTGDIWIRAIATCGNEVITGDWFGKLRIWNRITGRCLQIYHADNAIDGVCKVGERYFAVTKGGRLHVLTKEA